MSSTTQQTDLRSATREFAAAEITPIAQEHDRLGASPLEVYDSFWRQGLATCLLPDSEPTDYLTDACIVAEELAYACAATATLIMLPGFFNRLVLSHLREPARDEFRNTVLSRPVITSFAASEAKAGSDFNRLETEAIRVDGGYVLRGHKAYSSNVRHADYVIVVARTGSDGERSPGLSWFLVPRTAAGVTIGPRWQTLGLRSLDVSPVDLSDVYVPDGYRLGEQGRGLSLMNDGLAQSRTGIGAIAVGVARRARDEVMAYGASRSLYGQKLYKLQDYRFRIAAMEVDISAARALVQLSAVAYDKGLAHSKEASIAKLYAGQMVMRVTGAASEMLGSAGYTGQTVIEKLLRDARHTGIVEGTDPTHKEIIFANMLRRGAC